MSGGRIALLVVGSLLALIGLGAAAGGGVLLWAHETQRDADGYFTTSTERLRSASTEARVGGAVRQSRATSFTVVAGRATALTTGALPRSRPTRTGARTAVSTCGRTGTGWRSGTTGMASVSRPSPRVPRRGGAWRSPRSAATADGLAVRAR